MLSDSHGLRNDWRKTLYDGDQLDAATARRLMEEVEASLPERDGPDHLFPE